MQRKVIQIANSTQLISLPRSWSIKNNIKKGDELEVNESNNRIIVSIPSLQSQEKKLEITIDSPDKFLRRMLFSPYIQGCTEIKVNYTDPEVFNLISNEVQLLMGYEIITQGANYCVIRSVATALDNDFDNILKRIFWSTISMMEGVIGAMDEFDYGKLGSLRSLEQTNNKLSYFSLRILNTKGYKDENKRNSLYYTILEIEEIFDDLRDICDYIAKKKIKVDKTTIDMTKKCMHYFKKVHDLFNKFDTDMLYEFNKGAKELHNEILKHMQKKHDDVEVLGLLHNIMTKTSHISKEIHY